jgi:hypothetical protein
MIMKHAQKVDSPSDTHSHGSSLDLQKSSTSRPPKKVAALKNAEMNVPFETPPARKILRSTKRIQQWVILVLALV